MPHKGQPQVVHNGLLCSSAKEPRSQTRGSEAHKKNAAAESRVRRTCSAAFRFKAKLKVRAKLLKQLPLRTGRYPAADRFPQEIVLSGASHFHTKSSANEIYSTCTYSNLFSSALLNPISGATDVAQTKTHSVELSADPQQKCHYDGNTR